MTDKRREFISEESLYFLDEDYSDVELSPEEIVELKKEMEIIPEVEINERMLEKFIDQTNQDSEVNTLIEDIMDKEGIEMEEVFEEIEERHKNVEFLSDDELLNYEGESDEERVIKFRDIQEKKLKELTKEEKKVALGHFLIINVFLIINLIIVLQFVKLGPDEEPMIKDNNTEIKQEFKGDSEYTRYITKDTFEKMDENSKWKTDEELNKTLTEVFEKQENLDQVDGYELEAESE